ncbi:MAG: hypothetical protein JWP97_3625 [Labilithrix sp.]|nr:hypothetical protein [Labilithrix sp.]
MNRKMLAVALVLSAPVMGLWIAGCGDDEVFRDEDASTNVDGAAPDSEGRPDTGTPDGKAPLGCGDATGAPQRLLLSINHGATSELAAFDVAGKKVDGHFTYPGFIGYSSSQGSDPYVLGQATDVVYRMNAQRPWEATSSWSVAGDDAVDGGSAYSDPTAIVVPDCKLGYVIRFKRNKIAVIDTTKALDAGAPESYVDLAPLLQPNDKDGLVDMTAALHVPGKNRIYVLLGNEDLSKVAPDGFTALCADTTPSIVAIDTTTGALVSLGGTAPGGGIALGGYNPPLGASLAYDAARDRLLVLSAGCNADNGGAAGAIQRRRVEEVDLATGKVKTLLSLDTQGFPAGLVFADDTRAAISFFGQAFFWNPSQTTLGAEIPGGIDYGAHDGKGNLVGARATYLADGGAGPLEVISVPFGDGGSGAPVTTKLGENPFSDNAGYLSGAEMWPHP